MFWKHEIQVPAGFEAAVNFDVTNRRPVYVGADDQIHFVSLAPSMLNVSAEAKCREGVSIKLAADIRLEIPKASLADVLKDSGYSIYNNIVRVLVKDVTERQNLASLIKACLQTFIRGSEFFSLTKQEDVRVQLNAKVHAECARAKLAAEVVSSDVVLVLPDPELLAQLRAQAGMTESSKDGVRSREYRDAPLGRIVDYFLETLRQKDLIKEESERAKDEAERARVERQQQMTQTRADLKIVELEQEDRIATRQANLQAEEMKRQQEAQKRNADIKETSAQYEFTYKTKRLEQELNLAQGESELAKAKETEDAALRERKRLDMHLELERERELAKIRGEERANGLADMCKVFEKLKEIPAVNYGGVSTLVTGGGDSRDRVTGLLLAVLARMVEGGIIRGTTEKGTAGTESATDFG